MKLFLTIEAPEWNRPADRPSEEQGRKIAMANALQTVISSLANCGAIEGGIKCDGMRGSFKLNYPEN